MCARGRLPWAQQALGGRAGGAAWPEAGPLRWGHLSDTGPRRAPEGRCPGRLRAVRADVTPAEIRPRVFV